MTFEPDAGSKWMEYPTNPTTTIYNPDSIRAQLRIADWGNAVGNAPRWIPLPSATCTVATGSGAPASVPSGASFDLTCTWALTAGQKRAYRPDLSPGCTPNPGKRYAQQCIFAELESSAAPISFSSSSACTTFSFASSTP